MIIAAVVLFGFAAKGCPVGAPIGEANACPDGAAGEFCEKKGCPVGIIGDVNPCPEGATPG